MQSTSRLFKSYGGPYTANKIIQNTFKSVTHPKYPFFKKNYKKSVNAQVIVSKFFIRSAPNNLRNFQKFSKLYSNRKLYLKTLNPNSMYGLRAANTKQLSAGKTLTSIKLFKHPIRGASKHLTPFINNFFMKKIIAKNPLTQILFNPTLLKIASTVENYSLYKLTLYTFNKMCSESLNKGSPGQILGNPNNKLVTIHLTNLQPHNKFKFTVFKKIYAFFANNKIRKNVIPLYYHTLIRFVENCSGKKTLLQFYPFVNQCIDKDFIVRYKIWLPRLNFYERRLGHKFFLEEALHIMHLSFVLRDPKLLMS